MFFVVVFFLLPRSAQTQLLTPQSQTICQILILAQIAKHFDKIFPDSDRPRSIHLKPLYTWHWLNRIGIRTILCSHFVVNLSSVLLFVMFVGVYVYVYLFTTYQNLALDSKQINFTQRKLPCSWPDPFLGSQTRLSSELNKIRPCDSNFFGVLHGSGRHARLWFQYSEIVTIMGWIQVHTFESVTERRPECHYFGFQVK